jgi:hypothetical protein
LNLRPSGYERDRAAPLRSRLVPNSTDEQGVRELVLPSGPVLSRPVRRDTAEITAEVAMQSDPPLGVAVLTRRCDRGDADSCLGFRSRNTGVPYRHIGGTDLRLCRVLLGYPLGLS